MRLFVLFGVSRVFCAWCFISTNCMIV
jgi:hypothetical protein